MSGDENGMPGLLTRQRGFGSKSKNARPSPPSETIAPARSNPSPAASTCRRAASSQTRTDWPVVRRASAAARPARPRPATMYGPRGSPGRACASGRRGSQLMRSVSRIARKLHSRWTPAVRSASAADPSSHSSPAATRRGGRADIGGYREGLPLASWRRVRRPAPAHPRL